MPNSIASIEACIPALRRYARALVRGGQDPDDLVQETLLRALESIRSRRPDGEMRPWLFAIMHNFFISDRRKASARQHVISLNAAADRAAPSRSHQEDALHWQDCLRAFDTIPEDQREVLLLVSVEDFSYAEVAQVLAVPIGTVMSRLSRGRERLRALTGAEAQQPLLRRVK
jgi:RNA polymerase sigma-70 factor (ECF subfamily)